jgi:hypothetical protein
MVHLECWWSAGHPPQEAHLSLETKETEKDGADAAKLMGCLVLEN